MMTASSRPVRPRRLAALLSLAAVLTLVCASPAPAEVYTWTDRNGGVHVTDDPSNIPLEHRPAGSMPAPEEGAKHPPKPRPLPPVPDRAKEQEIGISVIDYGLFQVERLGRLPDGSLGPSMITVGNANTVRLLNKTDRVPALLGTKFGVRYRVTGGKPGERVEIETRVLHPGMRKTTVDGPRTPVPGPEKSTTSWRYPRTVGSTTYDGYIFEREWELVPGTWVFQLSYNGTMLAEKSFDVYAQKERPDPRVPVEVRREIEKLDSKDCPQRLSAVRQLEDMGKKAAPAVPALVRTLQYYSLPHQIAFDCGSGKLAPAALARIGQPAIKPLIEALGAPEWNIREGAKAALAAMGTKSVPPLIKALQKDTDPTICVGAAETLGAIKDSRVTPALIEAMQRNPWPQARGKSAEVLAKRKERSAVKPMVAVFKKPGENWHVRTDVLHALVAIVGTESARKLLPGPEQEQDAVVREELAALFGTPPSSGQQAVASAQRPDAAAPKDQPQRGPETKPNLRIQEELLAALRGADAAERKNAAVALGLHGDLLAVAPLIDALQDADRSVAAAAARSLGMLGDQRAARPLLSLLKDKNDEVRHAAMEALGPVHDLGGMLALVNILADRTSKEHAQVIGPLARMGAPVIPHLFDAIRREGGRVDAAEFVEVLVRIGEPAVGGLIQGLTDYQPKSIAAQALGRIRDPRAIGPLAEGMKDGVIAEECARALGSIGAPAVPKLLETLSSPNAEVRRFTLLGIALSGDPQAADVLIRALTDASPRVRHMAVEQLERLPGKKAVPALITVLKDPSPEVRRAAVHALEAKGDRRAVEPLMKLVKTDRESRSTAIKALGSLKDKRATKHLIPYLADKDQQLRWAAADALGAIGDRTALPALVRTLDDKDETVKYAAWGALRKISGKDFGPERADWEAWMKRNRAAAGQP